MFFLAEADWCVIRPKISILADAVFLKFMFFAVYFKICYKSEKRLNSKHFNNKNIFSCLTVSNKKWTRSGSSDLFSKADMVQ